MVSCAVAYQGKLLFCFRGVTVFVWWATKDRDCLPSPKPTRAVGHPLGLGSGAERGGWSFEVK